MQNDIRQVNRGRKGRAVQLTALCLSVLLAAGTALASPQDEMEAAKAQAEAIRKEKEKTDAKLEELEEKRGDAAAYVSGLDEQMTDLQEELDGLNDQIDANRKEIKEKTVDMDEAQAAATKQEAAMKLRIRYMYENGESSFLGMLLGAKSMSDLLNKAEYIAQIAGYDRAQLEKFKALRERIAQDKETLETRQKELITMQQDTEAKKQSAQQLIDAKNREISQLVSQIGDQEQVGAELSSQLQMQSEAVAALEEEIRRAEARAAEEARQAAMRAAEEEARREAERRAAEEAARRAAQENAQQAKPADAPSAPAERETEEEKQTEVRTGSAGSGKATGSLSWPTHGTISSPFGARTSPTEGASSFHNGIDIAAATGTSIAAADGGTVITAGYSSSAGNYVVISHGGGLSTVYMHCSRLLVSEGDTVDKGDVIAKVGSTGISTGPHLHFGVRKNGSYVNPSQYLN